VFTEGNAEAMPKIEFMRLVPGCGSMGAKTEPKDERKRAMKVTKVAMLILAIALVLYILVPNLSWAEDGAALYNSQRSVCHGQDGAG
jgi:hypothetical protein